MLMLTFQPFVMKLLIIEVCGKDYLIPNVMLCQEIQTLHSTRMGGGGVTVL
jgi:hypothetical protein